jgi:hypothetical protein
MRLNEASKMRRPTPPVIGDQQAERYSLKDYGTAAACAAFLITPAPFFWAPPLWVLALLAAPSQRRMKAVDGARAAWPAARDDPPPLPVNDNRAPTPEVAEQLHRRAA